MPDTWFSEPISEDIWRSRYRDGASSDAPSVAATWDATSARRAAMMATLRCDHPDIERFVEAKRSGRAKALVPALGRQLAMFLRQHARLPGRRDKLVAQRPAMRLH